MSPTLIVLLSCLCLFTKGKIGYGQQVERQKYRKLKTSSEQAKESQTNKVRHRNKWWLIETTSNEEGETTNNEEGGTTNNNEEGETTNNEEVFEHSVDYQDDNDNIEPVCSSDKHGSVGLAIDTTA